jgi:hypothetical protein
MRLDFLGKARRVLLPALCAAALLPACPVLKIRNLDMRGSPAGNNEKTAGCLLLA